MLPRMTHSRREFLGVAAMIGASPLVARFDPFLRLQPGGEGRAVFIHGVASGDPLSDRVILWTRVSGAPASARPRVRWEIATDQTFGQVVRRGELATDASRDFTVKVDASGLRAGNTYYYRFLASGERSPVGRTRTLPDGKVTRLRLALASCSNLPFGYFNAYRGIANRADLDAVVHLGDYIYEYANAGYGDGTRFGRIPAPNREILSLEDYRTRHAQYKTDPDLQEAHRQHPWIAVWDDHEITNNAWRGGAQNHNPEKGEGDWMMRRDAAVRAYFEWMPVRGNGTPRAARIYRTFRLGSLADLVMLDTRLVGREQQAAQRDQLAMIDDPRRSLLGRAQEEWLFGELRQSIKRGTRWQLLGQQVMFAPAAPPGQPSGSTDNWDGYRPARDRIVEFLGANRMKNAVILTGDVHSSWAYDVAKDPWGVYDPATGRGATAIEIVAPSVTSPGWDPKTAADRARTLQAARPHLRWADGSSRGYVVLDVTQGGVQADWFAVPTVEERTSEERFDKGFVSAFDSPHLVEASTPARGTADAPDLAR